MPTVSRSAGPPVVLGDIHAPFRDLLSATQALVLAELNDMHCYELQLVH